jgi:hypothetical protein
MTTFETVSFPNQQDLANRLHQLGAVEQPLGVWAKQNHYEREYGVPYGTAYVRGLELTIARYD